MSALIPALIQLAIGRMRGGGGGGGYGGGSGGGRGGQGGSPRAPKQQFSAAEKSAYGDLSQMPKPFDAAPFIRKLQADIDEIDGLLNGAMRGGDLPDLQE